MQVYRKIVVMGGAEIGKTRLIRMLCGDDSYQPYLPTYQVEVSRTEIGDQVYEFWECPGYPLYMEPVDQFCQDSDGLILLTYDGIDNVDIARCIEFMNMNPRARVLTLEVLRLLPSREDILNFFA